MMSTFIDFSKTSGYCIGFSHGLIQTEPKSGSPTIHKNISSFKKLESQHQKWELRAANQQLVRALFSNASCTYI